MSINSSLYAPFPKFVVTLKGPFDVAVNLPSSSILWGLSTRCNTNDPLRRLLAFTFLFAALAINALSHSFLS